MGNANGLVTRTSKASLLTLKRNEARFFINSALYIWDVSIDFSTYLKSETNDTCKIIRKIMKWCNYPQIVPFYVYLICNHRDIHYLKCTYANLFYMDIHRIKKTTNESALRNRKKIKFNFMSHYVSSEPIWFKSSNDFYTWSERLVTFLSFHSTQYIVRKQTLCTVLVV